MQFSTENRGARGSMHLITSVAVAAVLSLVPQVSRAAPLGGQVASGSATISASGLVTTVNQSTDRAVIDWQSFNLGQNETARFVVPSDQGATLNRISGGLSTISGTVESNGTVYFSNPNGLVFDATSRVSANGFYATTASPSPTDFMNRGEFSKPNRNAITLNGAISAPAITALAGTVTVGGNLAAGSGLILLSSTTLTTIGSGAVISADAGLSGVSCLAADCAAVPAGATGSGGNIKIWSDSHTDFLGTITALGGSNFGDGGLVEVSGKRTLNFSGTVSTLAPHGKTGTLLLDPATIEIVAVVGSDPTVSYITVANLANALATSNLTIDAGSSDFGGVTHTNGSGTDGRITVSSPFSWSGTGNLALIAGAGGIVIKAAITSTNATKARRSLVAGGGIRAETAVLTVDTLTATASSGSILLTGAN
ncbi:MAG: filamentous hemagglutinin N-terminal domain-containing protein, partial [Alphaproteobacteria bacterium]|nr:filamentous hemagglutinin N-terminal domain-containing protein [Alphaproteobacteria bacterium]